MVILGLSFMGLLVGPEIAPVHAYSNGLYASSNGTACIGLSSCTAGTLSTNVGDLILLEITCSPSTVIATVTDATGDTINSLLSYAYTLALGSTPSYREQVFYASSAKSTSTSTISISLGSTASYCTYVFQDFNTQSTGYLSAYGGTFTANDVGAGSVTLEAETISSAPANTFFWAISVRASGVAYSSQGQGAAQTPLVTSTAQGGYLGLGPSQTSYVFEASPYSGTLSSIDTATFYDSHVSLSFMVLAFGTTGSGSGCTSSLGVQGSTNANIKAAGTTYLKPNYVYTNWFNTGSGYVTMTQVQLSVASIAVSGTQQLTLGLYVSSSMPPTSASPAYLSAGVQHTWPITTSASPQNFSFTFSYQTPPNSYVLVTAAVSAGVVTVYNSTTTGSPISIDTSNAFMSGVPPPLLSDMTMNLKNVNLFGSFIIPCTQQIIQTQTSVSTVTTGGTGGGGGMVNTNPYSYVGLAIITTFFLIALKAGGMAGALFGGILGIIICIMGGFLSGALATVSLVSVLIGCLAVIYAGRSNGGGGGI